MSPTARTLDRLRRHGWTAQVVEQTIRGAGIIFKRDLWGCVDVLAIRSEPRPRILGVQACISGDLRRRLDKAGAEPRLIDWLRAGGEFQAWGWVRRGDYGERKLWEVRRVEIVLEAGALVEIPRET